MKTSRCKKFRASVLVFVVVAGLVPAPVEATTSLPAGKAGVATTYDTTHPLHAPKVVNGVEYQYDSNGNLTNDGQRVIEWNRENRPSTINTMNYELSTANYVYDGDGRRIIKKCQSANGQCQSTVYINQYLQLSTTNYELSTTHYYFANGKRVAATPAPARLAGGSPTDEARHAVQLHQDHLGSTRLLTNDQGQSLEQFSVINYYPYGERVSGVSGVNGVRYLYTGQELDAESNLYNLNARLYNPTTASFISADQAQGPNRYAYAVANPVRFTDPTGQRIEDFTPREWREFRRQERLAAKPPRLEPTADLLASTVTVSLDVQSPVEYSVSINEQVVAAIFQTLLPPGTNLSRRVIISPSISPPCPSFAPGCADVPGGGEVYLNPWVFPLSTEGLAVNLAPGFSQEDVYTFFLVSNLFHELHHSFLENWGVFGDPNRRFLEAEATGVGLAVASAYSGFSWEKMRETLESFRQGYLPHPQFSHYAPVLYPQITSEVYGYWRRIFEAFEPVSVTIP